MAIEAIGKHPDGRALKHLVLSAMDDPSEYVERTALGVVGSWNLAEGHDGVLRALEATPPLTRNSAIRALASVWHDDYFSKMFELYRVDAWKENRREAAWVLQRCVNSTDWRTLFDAFYQDEPPRHRKWACDLAQRFSGADLVPRLLQLCADSDGHVRKAASRAISAVTENSEA